MKLKTNHLGIDYTIFLEKSIVKKVVCNPTNESINFFKTPTNLFIPKKDSKLYLYKRYKDNKKAKYKHNYNILYKNKHNNFVTIPLNLKWIDVFQIKNPKMRKTIESIKKLLYK